MLRPTQLLFVPILSAAGTALHTKNSFGSSPDCTDHETGRGLILSAAAAAAPVQSDPSDPPADPSADPPADPPTDHCDPKTVGPHQQCYHIHQDLKDAATAVDNHTKTAKNSVGQQFAERFFDKKTIPLGSFKPDSTESGWSLYNLELKNAEQWLMEKSTTFWKGYGIFPQWEVPHCAGVRWLGKNFLERRCAVARRSAAILMIYRHSCSNIVVV